MIPDVVEEFKAVRVKTGDSVYMPEGYGHLVANVGSTYFVTADDSPVNFDETNAVSMPGHADYEPVKKMQGFAYYVVEHEGKPALKKMITIQKLKTDFGGLLVLWILAPHLRIPHTRYMPPKFVVWFNEVDKEDIPLVGGKGANLGEMTKAGFPVPGGFIVTSAVYKHFLDVTHLRSKIESALHNLNVSDSKTLIRFPKPSGELITGSEFPGNRQ